MVIYTCQHQDRVHINNRSTCVLTHELTNVTSTDLIFCHCYICYTCVSSSDSRSFRQNNTLYICIISGNYGERGIEVFKELARERNVCIAESLSAPTVDGDDEFDRIIKALLKNKNASVVVCFCEGRTARRLINAMKDYPEAQGHFQILAR